jgi:hypothetical protein
MPSIMHPMARGRAFRRKSFIRSYPFCIGESRTVSLE